MEDTRWSGWALTLQDDIARQAHDYADRVASLAQAIGDARSPAAIGVLLRELKVLAERIDLDRWAERMPAPENPRACVEWQNFGPKVRNLTMPAPVEDEIPF